MPRVKVVCYEIPIELGDHRLYLISTTSEKAADNYIKRKFGITITHSSEDESGAYFAGHMDHLYLYYPPNTPLEYLVHEITHIYKYIIHRMGTNPDEEGEAYMHQMLFRKIVDKLIEVNLLKIGYAH
jgi:hypothetical protein